MTKKDWILRVDGVNFGSTVFNTNQLSVIRGASLTLEAFGYEVLRTLKTSDELKGKSVEPIALAAAQAVIRISDLDDNEAETVRVAVDGWLRDVEDLTQTQRRFVSKKVMRGVRNRDDVSGELIQEIPTPSEHMTFVMDIVPLEGSSIQDIEDAVTFAQMRNRRRQLYSPTLPPSKRSDAGSSSPKAKAELQCKIDPNQQIDLSRLRHCRMWAADGQLEDAKPSADGLIAQALADRGESLKDNHRYVSERSADLRLYGRNARQEVYVSLMGPEIGFPDGEPTLMSLVERGLYTTCKFADSLQRITDKDAAIEGLPVSLQSKIAYFYIDGAGFSKFREALGIQRFSKLSARIWARVTAKLVDAFMPNDLSAFSTPTCVRFEDPEANEVQLRLETLIAGGDDYCIVMPSWLALEMAVTLLDWLEAIAAEELLALGRQTGGVDLQSLGPMVFRLGLLIGPTKSPFRKGFTAAYQLNEDARAAPDSDGKSRLCVHIVEGGDIPDVRSGEVLRGARFETSGPSLCDLTSAQQTEKLSKQALRAFFATTLVDFKGWLKGINTLKNGLARGQLLRLIDFIERSPEIAGGSAVEALKDEYALLTNRNPETISWGAFCDALPGVATAPVNLRMKIAAELWDFVDPLESPWGDAE